MLLRREHSLRRHHLLCLALLIITVTPLYSQTATTLYTFTAGADGAYPKSTLVRDTAGNLYGTTTANGASGNGTVFKIDTSQSFSVVHSFGIGEGHPVYGLVQDSSGNLYGTTVNGGDSDLGTVFKIDPSGTYSVIHNFDGTGGSNPYGPLAVDAAGNLYGTTSAGGTSSLGTVFELDAANHYSVLHSFAGGVSDGSTPYSSLARDSSGNLFGTTSLGGPADSGTIFEISTDDGFSLLYSFTGGSDGANPIGGPMLDSAGTLYVSASAGGSGYAGGRPPGTLLKFSTTAGAVVLHSFTGGPDGASPYAAPVMDAYTNLYGTTYYGGSGNDGTLFGIDSAGTYSVLYRFTNTGGINPEGLVVDSLNNIYGVTMSGGALQFGAVYKFAVNAKITAPADHSTLGGSTVNFTWTPESGATSYQLWLGSSAGADDIGYVGTGTTNATFTSVPTDGRTVYATLYGYADNAWSVQDTALYTAATLSKAQILSPAKGSVLPGTTVAFTWSAETGATSYQLWLGSAPGTYDLGVVGSSGLQGTISNLPTDGRLVYATLWGYDSVGNWSVQDIATYTAIALTTAQITSPAKGSTLPGRVVFTWTAETGATSYQLWVGSSPGADDITYVESTGLSGTVTGLPRDGRALYVTLWGYSSGTWTVQDSGTYTSLLSAVVMSLVLDRSGSMTGNGGSTALEAAVPTFISDFKNGLDQIGLISFADNSRIDVSITSNFQVPVDNAIAGMVFDGGTFGTGAGSGALLSSTIGPPMSLADLQTNSVVLPPGSQEVKVMVYFTDGLMNTIQDMMACTNLTPVNTLYNYGGFDAPSGNYFDFFDPTKNTYETGDLSWLYGDSTTVATGTSSAGCGPTTGQHGFCKGSIPYNNIKSCKGPTTFPSQKTGGIAAFTRANITAEAQYRALYTANQMRGESPVPTYIYVIGLGTSISGDPCTEAFLATMANDPSALNYSCPSSPGSHNFNQPSGALFLVPNCPSSQCTAELTAAFQLIASKLL